MKNGSEILISLVDVKTLFTFLLLNFYKLNQIIDLKAAVADEDTLNEFGVYLKAKVESNELIEEGEGKFRVDNIFNFISSNLTEISYVLGLSEDFSVSPAEEVEEAIESVRSGLLLNLEKIDNNYKDLSKDELSELYEASLGLSFVLNDLLQLQIGDLLKGQRETEYMEKLRHSFNGRLSKMKKDLASPQFEAFIAIEQMWYEWKVDKDPAMAYDNNGHFSEEAHRLHPSVAVRTIYKKCTEWAKKHKVKIPKGRNKKK